MKIDIQSTAPQSMTADQINNLAWLILSRKGNVDFGTTSVTVTPATGFSPGMAGIIVKASSGKVSISGATEISDEVWEYIKQYGCHVGIVKISLNCNIPIGDVMAEYLCNIDTWNKAIDGEDNEEFIVSTPYTFDYVPSSGDILETKVYMTGGNSSNSGIYIKGLNYGVNLYSGSDRVVKACFYNPWSQSNGISIILDTIVNVKVKLGSYIIFGDKTESLSVSVSGTGKIMVYKIGTPTEYRYSTMICKDSNGNIKRMFIPMKYKDTYILHEKVTDSYYLV